jgi:hypothetical protein
MRTDPVKVEFSGASKLIKILAENFRKSIVSKKGPNVGISLGIKILHTILSGEELTIRQSEKQVRGCRDWQDLDQGHSVDTCLYKLIFLSQWNDNHSVSLGTNSVDSPLSG